MARVVDFLRLGIVLALFLATVPRRPSVARFVANA